MANELKPWKYDIQYGPEGEANYAWVYDDQGVMVATMKTHKAKQIVDAMNTCPAPAATDTGLVSYEYGFPSMTKVKQGGDWCLRSQVEVLLSAERAGYEAVLADKRRLTRLLDVAMHGEDGAAKQASLCDLIEPAKRLRADNAAKDARIKELETERTMIVSHATMGQTDGIGLTVNDISVRVSALRNELYEEAEKRAEALGARIKEREQERDEYRDKWQSIMEQEKSSRRTYLRHTEALEAKLAAANDLVVRAQVIIPDHYVNWHRDARAVLGGKPS